ncbi:hypothetical protein DSECCO2_345760 [anaerobic digester metagenome]
MENCFTGAARLNRCLGTKRGNLPPVDCKFSWMVPVTEECEIPSPATFLNHLMDVLQLICPAGKAPDWPG